MSQLNYQRPYHQIAGGHDARPAFDPAGELYAARLPGACGETLGARIDVRLARSEQQRIEVDALINRMYAWRGYGDSHHVPACATHSTFVASVDGRIAGTITLGVDSPAGLAADAIFREEINTFRRVPGTSVCELTKFAFDTDSPSKALLARLFHIVFIYGSRRHRCTDLFIEVNPRHRRFYESMLGFESVGELKTNTSVAAPAHLMWLKVANIRAQIDAFGGIGEEMGARSLYPFFLSHDEERAISRYLSGALMAPGGLDAKGLQDELIGRIGSA